MWRQVLLDGKPLEIQYVSQSRINALMPANPADRPFSKLVVVSAGVQTNAVDIRRVPESIAISLDGAATVGGPVWIHIDMKASDRLYYPHAPVPWEFECEEFEVRKDGRPLAPLALPAVSVVTFGANQCPGHAAPGPVTAFQNRLPLHLKYNLDEPGIYQVRLLQHSGPRREVLVQSDWTPIEIGPRTNVATQTPPQSSEQLRSDFLPNLLAVRDQDTLSTLLGYLYHPDPAVREYVAYALHYWPESVVTPILLETLREKGPTTEAARYLGPGSPGLLDLSLPWLTSDNKILAAGAFTVAGSLLVAPGSGTLTSERRSRVEQSLIAAASNLAAADPQTVALVTAALSQPGSEKTHDQLWSLIDRHIAVANSFAAIVQQKNMDDLPRLAEYAIASPDVGYIFIANARNAYGNAALPYLRSMLAKMTTPSLIFACTEELILANDPFGFTFAHDGIVRGGPLKMQIIPWLATHFPETHDFPQDRMLQFLTDRAAAASQSK